MPNEQRTPELGQSVIWHEPNGAPRTALVTTVWGPTMVNLAFISGDENKTDPYGRQIERETSCQHVSQVSVHGRYWRFDDEEPNAGHAPVAV